jgi:hypothetical protein
LLVKQEGTPHSHPGSRSTTSGDTSVAFSLCLPNE